MARKNKAMVIGANQKELLDNQKHTDWEIAQEQGRNRNGRSYLGHRVHGASKTKQGRNRNACRGRVDY